MSIVLDASAFFTDVPLNGPVYTTPDVAAELKDLASKCRFETLCAAGLQVREPAPATVAAVRAEAVQTGDAPALSETDIGVIALAYDLGAAVCTDDFALQNVAMRMKVPVQPILQRRAKPRQWRYRCSGCGRFFKNEGTCEFCGAQIKRKLK